MPICEHCGVEVEEGLPHCPLCGNPSGPVSDAKEASRASARPADSGPPVHVERWLWEIVSLFALAGATVVFVVDFAYGMMVTWARYPLVSIGFLWLSVTSVILLRKRGFLLLLCQTAALGLLLFLLDRITPGRPWFISLALPVTLLASVLSGSTVVFVRRLRLSPLPMLAVVTVSIGLFLLGLEAALNRYLANPFLVSWSLVASGCILPLVLFLFYAQVRLKRKHSEIRKILHL